MKSQLFAVYRSGPIDVKSFFLKEETKLSYFVNIWQVKIILLMTAVYREHPIMYCRRHFFLPPPYHLLMVCRKGEAVLLFDMFI